LSVPGLRGVVPRNTHLRYEGFDPLGKPIRREVSGFHARVVQHECDHLMGILYPMRMRDLSRFGFTDIIFPTASPTKIAPLSGNVAASSLRAAQGRRLAGFVPLRPGNTALTAVPRYVA
jgi:hypothetical protein